MADVLEVVSDTTEAIKDGLVQGIKALHVHFSEELTARTEQEKLASLRLETVMQYLHLAVTGGDAQQYFRTITPLIASGQCCLAYFRIVHACCWLLHRLTCQISFDFAVDTVHRSYPCLHCHSI